MELKFVENDESVVSSIPNVENVYNETNHGKYNHNNNNKSPLLQNLFQRKTKDMNALRKNQKVINEQKKITDDKLIFLKVISNTIKSGMDIVGVSVPEKM